ncbi:MAG: periplasmic heavy metal sensor [Gemmatimonadota bacterium]
MAVRSTVLVLALVASSLASAPLEAQRTSGSRSGDDRSRLEERIRAHVGDIIRHRLGLNDAEEARLSEIVEEYEQRRRELVSSEHETREEIERRLEAGTMNDAVAAALIARMFELREQGAALYREELSRLQEVLTPTQVLQLYQLRVELGRKIRAIRGSRDDDGDRRRNRPPGPGGGGDALER